MKLRAALLTVALTASALVATPAQASPELPEFQIDLIHEHESPAPMTAAASRISAASVSPAATGIPMLSSRPGSAHTVYLDFDGAQLTNTVWNLYDNFGGPYPSIDLPAFSLDDDRASFGPDESQVIRQTWTDIVELFAPFDVNVTTVEPDISAISKTDTTPDTYGGVIIFTDEATIYPANYSGLAPVNVFGRTDAPGMVYTQRDYLATYDSLATTAAHEIGHLLGLKHSGLNDKEYFNVCGLWNPIMGQPSCGHVVQWTDGAYPGATNVEDQIKIMGNQLGYLPDDHADQPGTATPVTPGTPASGLINSSSDSDWFQFAAGAGDITISVDPIGLNRQNNAYRQSPLDVQITLYDAAGTPVAASGNTPLVNAGGILFGTEATINTTLPAAGTYTLKAQGRGYPGTQASTGYNNYGSVGHYTVNVTTAPPMPAPPTLTIGGTAPKTAKLRRTYLARLTIVGPSTDAAKLTRISGKLPPGIRIVGTTITGKPTKKGTYAFTLKINDGSLTSDTKRITIKVR